MGKDWERRSSDDELVTSSEWVQMWKHLPHGVILLVVLVGLLSGGFFVLRSILMPAEERLRRDVYEESKSYIDGTIRDLDNLRLQWLDAEGLHRDALEQTALHRVSDFPADELPERLQEWIEEIRP